MVTAAAAIITTAATVKSTRDAEKAADEEAIRIRKAKGEALLKRKDLIDTQRKSLGLESGQTTDLNPTGQTGVAKQQQELLG